MNFIGDPHGKLVQLKYLLELHGKDSPSILLGDVGVGFSTDIDDFYRDYVEPEYDVYFINGNHDDPDKCATYHSYIKSGHCEILNGVKIMYLGGASSIDRYYRKEGLSWWSKEQCTQPELENQIQKAVEFKPDIIVSHTFPSSSCEKLFGVGKLQMPWISDALSNVHASCIEGIIPRTELAYQKIIEKHAPKYWIGGHWHMNVNKVIDGTNYVCLEELNLWTLDLSEIVNNDENTKENIGD